ncbi:nitric-oxide reductase large subunit [Kocuria soli]|uniref:Nitric-oxide reductase large subunit n=3 Tax=Kocuria TaxID=57493 RepID=A0A3N3ZUW8_9MICC|nr:nitric-oxide reductase large subunit [Kocuria soli]
MSVSTKDRSTPQPDPEFRVDATSKQMVLGKGWVQAIAMVMLFGFFVMGLLAYRTYSASMPLPDKIVAEDGTVVATGEDITRGQEIFNARGLQEYGSVLGHGAYLGPDWTAEYLRVTTDRAIEQYTNDGVQDPQQAVEDEWRTNRYDEETGTLTWTPTQVDGFNHMESYYSDFFGEPTTKNGLPANMITDQDQIHDLTAFYAWTAWAGSTDRPGHDYSYTNNWPAEPNVGNTATADLMIWSVLSLVVLLGGIGVLFAVYGRWSAKIGWHGDDAPILDFRQPGEVRLTPSQRMTVLFFSTIIVLFLAQALLGALTEHYRVELTGFFGFDMSQILPYNLARTWHVQLSLFWTAAGFLAAGIFLTPFIARREPKKQGLLTVLLYVAVVIVVVGTLLTTFLSVHGITEPGSWLSQQWEYLDLPRLFQILLTVGMFIWIAIVYRGMRARLRGEHKGNMPWLFFFAGLAIPAFYAVGMLASTDTHFSVADFWRFWVVHLWVEDFLELFTTVMVAYIFVLLGVVRERIAIAIIYMDIILYSVGGVIGTMHHLYFSGTPVEHMALGAFFSAAEVIPLTFLTVEAWGFMQLGSRQHSNRTKPFPHRWAVMFLVSVGFWNFLGAGIFGFLINMPIVSYYQIGTALTANHAHGAMMGVYGFLAIGMAVFALRYVIPPEKWPEKWMGFSFWALNIGLLWMVFVSLMPLGVAQLYHSVSEGYYEARSLGYLTEPGNVVVEWLRMPGDVIFLVGIVPLLYLAFLGLKYFLRKSPGEDGTTTPLYEEITPAKLAEFDAEERVEATATSERTPYRSDRQLREADKPRGRYRSDREAQDRPMGRADDPDDPNSSDL